MLKPWGRSSRRLGGTDLEWQTQLQYAEDIQDAIFDHIVTDAREFKEIIQEHKAIKAVLASAGLFLPPPLDVS